MNLWCGNAALGGRFGLLIDDRSGGGGRGENGGETVLRVLHVLLGALAAVVVQRGSAVETAVAAAQLRHRLQKSIRLMLSWHEGRRDSRR